VQRRIEQADVHRETVHLAEEPHEIVGLERQELVDGLLA